MKIIPYILALVMFLQLTGCTSKKAETAVEEHHEEENSVELSESQFKSAGITFGKVEMKNISSTVQANGLLDVPPQNLITVSAMMGGFIKTTELLQGMKVKKGEVIATIQNPDFIQIQQDYLDNSSKLKFAELEYQRQEELAKENVSSKKIFQQVTAEYNSLRAAHGALAEKLSIIGIDAKSVENGNIKSIVSIKSPITGYVTAVNINIGKFVNPQDVICEIVDTDHLHVELTVFEKDLTKIKVGQNVRFVLTNESNKERTAKIYLINKKIAEDRTVRIHAHLDKEDVTLVPNMYLKASIEVTDNKTTALPEEAIVSAAGKFYIFIKDDGHGHEHAEDNHEEKHEGAEASHGEEFTFKAIEVTKGVTQNGYTEVTLPEGFESDHAEVVIKGAYALLSKMNNSEEEGHSH